MQLQRSYQRSATAAKNVIFLIWYEPKFLADKMWLIELKKYCTVRVFNSKCSTPPPTHTPFLCVKSKKGKCGGDEQTVAHLLIILMIKPIAYHSIK